MFYVLIAVGFLALYLTWRSNAQCVCCGAAVALPLAVPGRASLLGARRFWARAAARLSAAARPLRPPWPSLKEWKRNLEATVARERGRRFEPGDAAKLYGMF